MSSDQSSSLIFLVVIVAAFWFLVLRPARKRNAQATQLQRSIELGDRVMLTSGIFGYITGLGEQTLQLELADGVEITALRQAVARVVSPDEPVEEYEYEDADSEADSEADEGTEHGNTDGDRHEDTHGDEQDGARAALDAAPEEERPQTVEGRTDDDRR